MACVFGNSTKTVRVIITFKHMLFPDKGGKSQSAETAKSWATSGNRGAQHWQVSDNRIIKNMEFRIY